MIRSSATPFVRQFRYIPVLLAAGFFLVPAGTAWAQQDAPPRESTVTITGTRPALLRPEADVRMERQSWTDTESWRLVIETQPADAVIRVDGVRYAGNPVTISGTRDRWVRIEVSRAGNETWGESRLCQTGYSDSYLVTLPASRAWLELESDRPIQEVLVDYRPAVPESGLIPASPGYRYLTVRSFGQKDLKTSLILTENTITSVHVEFAPAPFTVSAATFSRPLFRPGNTGSLGSTTLSFLASAPGDARLEIRDGADVLVASHDFESFSTWYQSWTWDGRDPSGAMLPDGTYPWVLTARDGAGTPSVVIRGTLRIDSTSLLRPRQGGNGLSGSAGVADTLALDGGAMALGFSGTFETAHDPDAALPALGFDAWYRMAPARGWECTMGALAGAEAGDSSAPVVLLYGGVKLQLIRPGSAVPGFSLAAGLQGSVIPAWEGLPSLRTFQDNLPGLGLSMISQLDLGDFFANIETGMALSPLLPYDTSLTDLSWVPRPSLGFSFGLGTDTLQATLGGRLEFLPFDWMMSGAPSGADRITRDLAAWGMVLPPSVSVECIIPSPWGMSFSASAETRIFPGDAPWDHLSFQAGIIMMR